jgi:hypothetical protein
MKGPQIPMWAVSLGVVLVFMAALAAFAAAAH